MRERRGALGSDGPTGFVQAWRHIVDVFRANGATNVAWVFCPGQDALRGDCRGQGPGGRRVLSGNQYVDWIAEDAYSRAKPVPITTLVAGRYSEYGTPGSPSLSAKPVLRGPTRHSSYPE